VNSDRVYLDHAATTPVRAEAALEIERVLKQCDFNPSSLHAEGRQARAVLDGARDRTATLLGASRGEIVFTSGGTESNNLALFGLTRAMARPAHVVASAIEHHSIIAALARLREEGIETTLVPVDAEGRVDPEAFERALRPQTVLASIMYANNEVGTIAPIRELAEIAHRRNVLFHTDAVAAPAWLPIDVQALGVDLLSLSAHKFYGPKGAGLLFVRRGVPLAPVMVGGCQEHGRRSGTENVAGVAGMAAALELAVAERPERAGAVAQLRDHLEAEICARVEGVRVNAGAARRLANISHLSFAALDAPALLIALDLAGIAVSAGSACASGTLEPSHVLAAMAPAGETPRSGIRFSLGTRSTPAQVERVLTVLPGVVADLRGASPVVLPAGGLGRFKTNRARLEAEA
jgi:cysteine desulfurase